jgi:hypothetical protein
MHVEESLHPTQHIRTWSAGPRVCILDEQRRLQPPAFIYLVHVGQQDAGSSKLHLLLWTWPLGPSSESTLALVLSVSSLKKHLANSLAPEGRPLDSGDNVIHLSSPSPISLPPPALRTPFAALMTISRQAKDSHWCL